MYTMVSEVLNCKKVFSMDTKISSQERKQIWAWWIFFTCFDGKVEDMLSQFLIGADTFVSLI